jgi:hypothetical protein
MNRRDVSFEFAVTGVCLFLGFVVLVAVYAVGAFLK